MDVEVLQEVEVNFDKEFEDVKEFLAKAK